MFPPKHFLAYSCSLPNISSSLCGPLQVGIYTEQMLLEGLGRKLLLTSPRNPRKSPEKQTVGPVNISHKMLTLQVLPSSLIPALQTEAAWNEERTLGDLRQSVPQNGGIHLHFKEGTAGKYRETQRVY